MAKKHTVMTRFVFRAPLRPPESALVAEFRRFQADAASFEASLQEVADMARMGPEQMREMAREIKR